MKWNRLKRLVLAVGQTSVRQVWLLAILSFLGHGVSAQTFEVDGSRPIDPPLVKTKFGVYQTPLVALPQLLNSTALLTEAGVRDFRYEIGWGKSDVLAFDQISGATANPQIDFSTLDQLLQKLQAQDVQPLLCMGYCPIPLQSRPDWAAWKDLPRNLENCIHSRLR